MNDFGNTQVTEAPANRPKTGGRKKGVPNKVTREIRELAQKYTLRAVKKVWKLAEGAEDQESGELETDRRGPRRDLRAIVR